MAPRIYTLTPAECEIIDRSKEPGQGNLFTGYFFSKEPGRKLGWQFDANFDPEHAWQLDAHHTEKPRVIIAGGFASGKTWGIGVSGATKSAQYPDFNFTNLAPTYKQSKIMYSSILTIARGAPYEKLIWRRPIMPMPQIILRFYYRGELIISTMEFWSGYDSNTMLTSEVDWLNIEQAESFDNLDDVLMDASSRVRGSINGRERLGRLSMIANSEDNPTFWQQFEYAETYPEDYFTRIVSTRHNRNVSPKQLRMILRDIPEDQQAQKIDAARPEGKGLDFKKEKIMACESEMLDELLEQGLRREEHGYLRVVQQTIGVVEFGLPRIDSHNYIMIGDIGKGRAPFRNAPVWKVWDIDTFPFRMSYLWWGDGKGSIDPFVDKMFEIAGYYRPEYIGVDNTGPQSGTVETINRLIESSDELAAAEFSDWQKFGQDAHKMQSRNMTIFLSGMDFSGSKKGSYLLANQTMLSAGMMTWPKSVTGMRAQHLSYDRNKDRGAGSKLAQDLVSTNSMSAYILLQIVKDRRADEEADEEDDRLGDLSAARISRVSREGREQRSAVRS